MTEISYLWDGIVTGDATEAPYDKTEFNRFLNGIHSADTDDALVVPGYLNDLEVVVGGGMAVSILSGAAIIKNYIYTNTESTSLAVDTALNGYYRFDYVALEADFQNQTVRLVIVKGSEVNDYTALENPLLTQTGSIWQAPIARIYVLGGVANIPTTYIYDERIFAVTTYSKAAYNQVNLLENSELMIIDSSNLPEGWVQTTTGTTTTLTASTKTTVMPRGQTLRINSTKSFITYATVNPVGGDVYTLKGTFREITGDDSLIRFSVLQVTNTISAITGSRTGTGPTILQKEFIRLEANDEVEFSFTFKINETQDAATGIAVNVYSTDGNSEVGQLILVKGYHPGPFRQITEFIPFQTAVTDASWSDTAKSTSTTTIDFTADFGGEIQPQTKAVLLRLRARDSGSAGGSPYMRILGYAAPFVDEYGRLDLEGVTNDVYRENTCVVPVNQPQWDAQDDTPQLRIDVVATGAGTLDATVEVLGIFV